MGEEEEEEAKRRERNVEEGDLYLLESYWGTEIGHTSKRAFKYVLV